MNDNQSYADRLAHWTKKVEYHAQMLDHHRRVGKVHQDLESENTVVPILDKNQNNDMLLHHQNELAKAEFQRRKYEILSGGL